MRFVGSLDFLLIDPILIELVSLLAIPATAVNAAHA